MKQLWALFQIIEYDFTKEAITCSTVPNFKSDLYGDATNTAICNILLDENNENVVVFHNDEFLFVLEKSQVMSNSTTVMLCTYKVLKSWTNLSIQYILI